MEVKDVQRMFFSSKKRRKGRKGRKGANKTIPEDAAEKKTADESAAAQAAAVEECPTLIDSTGLETQEDFNVIQQLGEDEAKANQRKMALEKEKQRKRHMFGQYQRQEPSASDQSKMSHQSVMNQWRRSRGKLKEAVVVVTVGKNKKNNKCGDYTLLDAAALQAWREQPIGVQFDEMRKKFTDSEANDLFFGASASVKDFPWFLNRYAESTVLISDFCSERSLIFGVISEYCGDRYKETRTLELAVSYVDRALAYFFDKVTKSHISAKPYDIRLTAIAACWLATKLEESCPALTKHFIGAYHGSWKKVTNRSTALTFELNFKTNCTTPSNYLRFIGMDQFATISQHPNIKQTQTVKFLIDVGMYARYEKGAENCCSSRVLASAAVILANLCTENTDQSRETVKSIMDHMSVAVVEDAVLRIYEFIIEEKNASNPIMVKFERHMGGKLSVSLPQWSVVHDMLADVNSSIVDNHSKKA